MGIGRLIYKIFFKPTLQIRYHIHHFGLSGWYKLYKGEQQMKKAAMNITPISLAKDHLLEVNYLTGANYWHQTIFCAQSLARVLQGRLRINIYSDGTLDQTHEALMARAIPGVTFISAKSVDAHLDQFLPPAQFPTLHYLRTWHPFFRRLIDIHCIKSWAIHLDSDMLFFDRPQQIIDAYQNKTAIYMEEHLHNSYFVDDERILKDKYNISCISNVNGGIIAYNGDVDYTDLEQKAKTLLDHYPHAGAAQVEQTLMSYLLFKQDAKPLNKYQYPIFYDSKIEVDNSPIVRHYIFKAKLPYFTSEWKRILH
ncbi:hypothetical protein [Mucilaginibacter sp. SG564]|uniref:hypothetical protein n=1 Tax=unclassified Mucilaginibacter TaxID=2617802 RepID=UPI001555AA25|nr:hypothetical protein [Mucilaginibacter sp. SG564]NOW98774.1 hypothetical protein [Mucilaginibacter sp. SG564]